MHINWHKINKALPHIYIFATMQNMLNQKMLMICIMHSLYNLDFLLLEVNHFL